jgi:magnesium-protoporphyrin IX monomethyl ester (oxidative) cyclase
LVGTMLRATTAVQAVWTFGRLYFLPVKRNDLPAQIRVQPAW